MAELDGFAAIPLDTRLQALALLLAIVVLWIDYAQLVCASYGFHDSPIR